MIEIRIKHVKITKQTFKNNIKEIKLKKFKILYERKLVIILSLNLMNRFSTKFMFTI